MLDNGHKTDILIMDGPRSHRIQIKTVEALGDDHEVINMWEGSFVKIVIYFARNSNWGYIAPAFKVKKRRINHETHLKFDTESRTSFLKAFHKI